MWQKLTFANLQDNDPETKFISLMLLFKLDNP